MDFGNRFQRKYLTASAGLLCLLGTLFPWTFTSWADSAPATLDHHIGFSTVAGLPFALFGCVVIFIATLYGDTKPGEPNSPVAALLALVFLPLAIIWLRVLGPICLGCEPAAPVPGFGMYLSLLGALLVSILGWLTNPRGAASKAEGPGTAPADKERQNVAVPGNWPAIEADMRSIDADDELMDLVDDHDNVIGQASRSEIHRQGKANFRAINAFLENSRGELFILRRSPELTSFPCALDMSVAGHVKSGETYEVAFRREAREELGLEIDQENHVLLGYLTPGQDDVSCFCKVYKILTEKTPAFSRSEFVEGYWLTPREVVARIESGSYAKDDLIKLVNRFWTAVGAAGTLHGDGPHQK